MVFFLGVDRSGFGSPQLDPRQPQNTQFCDLCEFCICGEYRPGAVWGIAGRFGLAILKRHQEELFHFV
jgi:hypothetical protein